METFQASHTRASDTSCGQEVSYQGFLKAIPQLVWITDAKGMPVYFNQRWRDYTAFAVTEDVEANWTYLLHPEDKQPPAPGLRPYKRANRMM